MNKSGVVVEAIGNKKKRLATKTMYINQKSRSLESGKPSLKPNVQNVTGDNSIQNKEATGQEKNGGNISL